jgi:hypothetical protein
MVALLLPDHAQEVQCAGVVGFVVEDLPVSLLRFGEPALL